MSDTIYKDGNNTAIFARKLHERSFLLFEYFDSDSEVIRAHLPFLQNISISEQGKANLASYSLLGRAGQLFSYGGAEARKLSIDFEINLLHLLHLQETEGFTYRFKKTIRNRDKGADRKAFTDGAKPQHKIPNESYTRNLADQFLDQLEDSTFREFRSKIIESSRYGSRNPDLYVISEDVAKTMDLAIYWVNLIRSSVLNNSKNTVYGPPIVRLNHGPLYMNSPCLVSDYKISIDPQSNYDLMTLLPYTIKISLTLLESRTGDFGDYIPKIPAGDNLTGWESVINGNVLESMNYNFYDFFANENRSSDPLGAQLVGGLLNFLAPITSNPGGRRFSGRPAT